MKTAVHKNTLVILPTALGKTVIGLLIAAERIRYGKVFFLAPTRPLVQQHYQTFSDKTLFEDHELTTVTGRISPEKRAHMYKTGRIIFATPQCLRNDLKRGILGLEDVSLIIFDEAHRARGNYAYVDIANYFVKQSLKPLTLGLTASPGSYKEKITEICRNLRIETIEYRAEEDEDVKPYIHPIDINWKRIKLPDSYLKVRDELRKMLAYRVKLLQSQGVLMGRNPRYLSRRDLVQLNKELLQKIRSGKGGHIYQLKIQATATLSIMHMMELIETQGPKTLESFIRKSLMEKAFEGSRGHKSISNDPLFANVRKWLIESLREKNPKMFEITGILTRQLDTNPDSRIIVFTQYRDTILSILKTLMKKRAIRAKRFVGQVDKKDDAGMNQKKQQSVLQQLRTGEINVLVATSIAEEGLDIPEVDRVIFYEPVPSEIRYIQRRGRTGRRVSGSVTLLIAENTIDEAFYWASMKKAKKMKEMIKKVNQKLPEMNRKLGTSSSNLQIKTGKDQKHLRETKTYRQSKLELWKPQIIQTKGMSQAVKWIMRNLPETPTPITHLIKRATEETSIRQPAIENAIWRLIQQGQLYQPTPGQIMRL